MSLLSLLSVVLTVLSVAPLSVNGQTAVNTSLGQIQGSMVGGVRVWQGIPYAEPPVGDLRFAPTIPKKSWSNPLNTTSFGPRCIQLNTAIPSQSEDCLYLNVYALDDLAQGSAPVFVYIHGGGYTSGSGQDYNATRFAKAGTVTVTINYRLGALGFLSLSEIQKQYNTTGGANGLLDQIQALQWVQNNIAAFGGDPDLVTVGGESAGGLSICLLNQANLPNTLFKRAVIFSGACNGPWGVGAAATMAATLYKADSTVAKVFGNESSLTALRALSTSELLTKSQNFESFGTIAPTFDGVLMSHSSAFTRSHAEKVIIGTTSMDGLFAYAVAQPFFPKTPSSLEMLLQLTVPNVATAAITAYSDLDNSTAAVYGLMNGDACLTCPTNNWAAMMADKFPNVPVYMYMYYKNAGAAVYDGKYALHAMELRYLFGQKSRLSEMPYPFGPWNITDTEFSQVFFEYINSFIVTGTPESTSQNTSVVPWEAWTKADQQYIKLGTDAASAIQASGGIRTAQCDVWKDPNDELQLCWGGQVQILTLPPTMSPDVSLSPTASPTVEPEPSGSCSSTSISKVLLVVLANLALLPLL